MTEEIWKSININRFSHYDISTHGNIRNKKGNIMSLQKYNDGYIRICLLSGKIKKHFFVHRIVAISFIENLEEKQMVNHLDGNKSNNNLTNLEWVTPRENAQHAINVLKINKHSSSVAQYDMDNNLITEFTSIKDASEKSNISKKYISNNCRNISKSAGGFLWKYVNNDNAHIIVDDSYTTIIEFPNYKINKVSKRTDDKSWLLFRCTYIKTI